MKVGEFFVDMGINATPGATTLKDFMGSMMGMKMSTLSAMGALGSVGDFLRDSVIHTANASVGLKNFSNQTNISGKELQKFQRIADQLNIPVGDVTGSLFNLQMLLAGIQRGEVAPEGFQKLLVDPTKGYASVIAQLRKRQREIDPVQFASLLPSVGMSSSMVNYFKASSDELEKFGAIANGISPQVEADTLRMVKSWKQLGLAIKDTSIVIGSILNIPLTGTFLYYADMVRNPSVPGIGNLMSSLFPIPTPKYSPIIGYAKPMTWGDEKLKGGPVTKTVNMNVYGDTHDKKFAETVAGMIDETEGQMPLTESIQ